MPRQCLDDLLLDAGLLHVHVRARCVEPEEGERVVEGSRVGGDLGHRVAEDQARADVELHEIEVCRERSGKRGQRVLRRHGGGAAMADHERTLATEEPHRPVTSAPKHVSGAVLAAQARFRPRWQASVSLRLSAEWPNPPVTHQRSPTTHRLSTLGLSSTPTGASGPAGAPAACGGRRPRARRHASGSCSPCFCCSPCWSR